MCSNSMSLDVLASLCTCSEYFNIAVSITMPISHDRTKKKMKAIKILPKLHCSRISPQASCSDQPPSCNSLEILNLYHQIKKVYSYCGLSYLSAYHRKIMAPLWNFIRTLWNFIRLKNLKSNCFHLCCSQNECLHLPVLHFMKKNVTMVYSYWLYKLDQNITL